MKSADKCSINMEKQELREIMKSKRRLLSSEQIEEYGKIAEKKLLPFLKNAKTIMIYVSAFKEVPTDGIIEKLLKNKTVAVPVSNTDTETITISKIESMSDFKIGAYGIKEPKTVKKISLTDIDVIIVPGIAFDEKCNRMGFGKGYYDKLLADFKGLKIGLCYDFQVVESVFPKSHDIPMDTIITEKRIINAI